MLRFMKRNIRQFSFWTIMTVLYLGVMVYSSRVDTKSRLYGPFPEAIPNQVQTFSLGCLFSQPLQPRQTLEALLTGYGLPNELIYQLSQALKEVVNLRQLQPGEQLSLWSSPDTGFVMLEYARTPQEIFRVSKYGEEISAYPVPVLLNKKIVVKQAVIENSLWESMMGQINSPEIILKLTDIFAWEIDFLIQTRPGDRLKIVYEELYKEDQLLEYGEILAAEVTLSGQTFRAFLYEDLTGKKAYYDDAGNSLQKAFLKSPLAYRRVSSGFSRARVHPVFQNVRPHYGVDFSAPTGTQVVSAADGVIRFAGWKGGLGRYLEIRHGNGWVTGYGHLSRFAKGMFAGKRVSQKDIVGYVGTTGWTTGPHLHYQVEISGRYVNPLKIQSPTQSPVRQEYLADFLSARQELLAKLESVGQVYAVSQK